MNATKEPKMNICGNFEAIYKQFITETNETWNELSQKVAEAQNTYQQSQSVKVDPSAAPENREFVQAVSNAWDAAQARYVDAYAKYVDGYKNTWVNVDATALSAPEMANISLSANLVAGHANSTIGNLSLLASIGVPPGFISMMGKDGVVE